MATKGKNNSRKKSNTRSRTGGSSKRASTRKKSSKRVNDELDFEDPFFEDSSKEIILWSSIALCILLCISNFGLGGVAGNAVADFLFGVFGIIQYVLPFMVAFSAFFIISNYGNKVAIAKVIAGFVLLMFISAFVELIINGQNILLPLDAFSFAKEKHLGGGLVGGGIVFGINDSFGLFGAYLIVLIAMIVCTIIIIERFAFDRVQQSSRYHADRAAEKRRIRRERQLMEREANQTRFNSDRQAIRDKIEKDKELELQQRKQNDGNRRDRRFSGVTSDTTIMPDFTESASSADGINEIRFNMADGEEEMEITKTSRHRLRAGDKRSKSAHAFKEIEQSAEEIAVAQPVISEPEPVIPKKSTISFKGAALMEAEQEAASIRQEQEAAPVRHGKASVASADEIENSSESLKASIDADKKKPKKPYKYPPLTLLKDAKKNGGDSKEYLTEMANKLETALSSFGVQAKVTEVTLGPSVTRYELEIAVGTRVSKVVNLADDIKLSLAVTDVRIEAPIPGKSAIGIEVPNKVKSMVGFKELVSSKEFKSAKSKISFCVGKDISGSVIVGNIEKMPHLLIAGATGSGKSVCINTIIMSILYHANPDEVKMIMVDPKMVELSVYNGIPHLLLPVITDAKKAAGALHWAVKEMTDRYELLAMAGVRNIEGFNEKVASNALPEEVPEEKRVRMSQLVIILDEVADLMMVAAADVEDSIVRLAQLARAAGIHLIIATQKPTVNVITGLIKANVPSRIAFSVSSGNDSRVILDMNGAEDLLGNGDMLYAPQNLSKPIRIQGAFVSDDEVSAVVDFLKNNNDPAEDNSEIEAQIQSSETSSGAVSISGEPDNSRDPLFAEAGRLVIENQKGSIGYLQRNFRIGFNRAARIMDQLAEAGVVGPEMGTKPREIRMAISEFEELINA
ncbi:DNA segregation ATPase FtsK/SpoIIIE, S-DNA-T family [Pseudobutyrivibrio sp. UC1225]|uniref:FtsK/SpoIIIE family DNA translocase n=1 Tax=Pseudobutyrivibrio sp. UC1225 TaxID=1798185 RepID=UPI0008EF7BC2|nr:DNA translocase FtsK [Pseudobutyrivibrio sp. UC1225]SFN45022.1 DNA segregation ATPase FtsK/SpoIIIE, S-DNA-T family [Pseudobutyrivibrio sp. UC1225]